MFTLSGRILLSDHTDSDLQKLTEVGIKGEVSMNLNW